MEMDQKYMMEMIVSLFFNECYSNIVLKKLSTYFIKENLHISYAGLSYTEYINLCKLYKQHNLYLGHYRYKGDIDYHTIFIFKINPKHNRLIYAIKNRYYHLLPLKVKEHITQFTNKNAFISSSARINDSIMKDEVTLTVKEELFIMQMAEQQDVQEPTLLEDTDCLGF